MSVRLAASRPLVDGAAATLALQLRDVGKEYRMYATPRQRLAALVLGGRRHRSQWVLRDVTFQLQRGQCMGVVGDNGAGKSSLLKLVAGTLQPSVGTVRRSGRVTAILELGSGFHPEFTGRENLFFGGQLIGLDEAEVARLAPGIIECSELGEAIDRPVKSYSSGMVVRLAFALVTALQPEVLIIDEALAVGDQHFQKKCIERIEAFRRNGCTILFCSHSPYHVRHLCDVALWLDGGRVQRLGPTEEVLLAYETHTRLTSGPETGAEGASAQAGQALIVPIEAPWAAAGADTGAPPAPPPSATGPAGTAAIVSVQLDDLGEAAAGSGEAALLPGPDLVARITVSGMGDERPHIGFMIEQSRGVGITSVVSHEDGAAPHRLPDGNWHTVLTFPSLPLHSGEYVVSVYLFDASGLVVYDQWYQFLHFRFVAGTRMPGLVRLPHHWS